VQPEGIGARDLAGGEQRVQQPRALLERAPEALLLGAHPLVDRLVLGAQLRVGGPHDVGDHRHVPGQEAVRDPDAVALQQGAAHDPAQHVAAILVGGHDAVGDEEGHPAGVVGQDPQRALVGLGRRQVAPERHERQELIGLEDRRHALLDEGHAVEAQARVDVLGRQRGERADRILVVLHEDEVPVLQEALVVAAGKIVLLAPLDAAVEVQLAARPARPGRARRPEVLRARQLDDPAARDADRLPCADGLLVGTEAELGVALEDADPDVVEVEAEALERQLERELDRALLEVVADREVAEHLEEGLVARGGADVLDVDRAEALLAGRQPVARRLLEAEEVGLERLHPRGGEQHRRIEARGHQRPARAAQVTARLEEAQERLADLVGGHAAIVAHPSTASPRRKTAVWPGAAPSTGSSRATVSPCSEHGTAAAR
jgi:hypothetical protein